MKLVGSALRYPDTVAHRAYDPHESPGSERIRKSLRCRMANLGNSRVLFARRPAQQLGENRFLLSARLVG